MIKVLICDDHQLMIEGLKLILGEMPEIKVVGHCINGQEAVDWVAVNEVDVILMDINMPVLDGIKACNLITAGYPQVRVIFLSMINQIEIFQVLIKSGAKGFLLKNSSSDEVESTIKKVYEGDIHFDPNLFNLSAQTKARTNFIPKLTKREKEILQLIINEYTSIEISEKLFISHGTVETHRRNLISKMGVKNTAGLVRMAIEYRLLT